METPSPDDPMQPPPLPPEPPTVLPAEPIEVPTVQQEHVPVLLPAEPSQAKLSQTGLFLACLGIGAAIYVLLLIISDQTREFALSGLEVLPFLGLALLAYAGESDNTFRWLTVVYWVLLVGAIIAFIVVFTGMADLNLNVLVELRDAARHNKNSDIQLSDLAPSSAAIHIVVTSALSLLAFLVGCYCFTRSARRTFAGFVPGFDADSFVHAVALATVVSLAMILLAPLVATGAPPMLTFINHITEMGVEKGGDDLLAKLSDQNILLDQFYSFTWLVPICLLTVGWPLHRTLSEALRRVGFVAPTLRQVCVGLGLAVVLAFVMTYFDIFLGQLWEYMHWPRTDETAVKKLFEGMNSPLGALVIGVTAGIGEELFVRGVLQPRLGILLSNLFFTALHALQYSWDGLVSVFLIGLILGLVRRKSNTSTSAIVHGTYDFLLVMASYYGLDKWLTGG